MNRQEDEEQKAEQRTMNPKQQATQTNVIKNFFTAEGRLKELPTKYKKKLIVLHHLVSELEPGRTYTEKEINEYIKPHHEDYATIRREFIIHGLMSRDREIYKLNPKEQWDRWDNLS
ncbi:transcriptional regulator [Fontibacillus phaseoli]|uniref:Transcriptional regulator n=1 Tax=Fontibacillus phaseoli TaxID=1416533 RepID=A0A369BFL5_9BACL|nr:DUF2087 domain-containing protein [Fontibacillus phaseoli]RCX20339.1 transcriptional regulator [Fontibacillus phaseoli]